MTLTDPPAGWLEVRGRILGGDLPAVSAEGWRLVPDHARGRVLRRLRKAGAKKRLQIYDRDGHTCVKCGATDRLTLDHIRPLAYGGTNDDGNLRTLCDPCNGAEEIDFYARAYAAMTSGSSSASTTA